MGLKVNIYYGKNGGSFEYIAKNASISSSYCNWNVSFNTTIGSDMVLMASSENSTFLSPKFIIVDSRFMILKPKIIPRVVNTLQRMTLLIQSICFFQLVNKPSTSGKLLKEIDEGKV